MRLPLCPLLQARHPQAHTPFSWQPWPLDPAGLPNLRGVQQPQVSGGGDFL
jgi:hypothetical protein